MYNKGHTTHRTENFLKEDISVREFPIENTGCHHLKQIIQVDITTSESYWWHVTSDKRLREGSIVPSVLF